MSEDEWADVRAKVNEVREEVRKRIKAKADGALSDNDVELFTVLVLQDLVNPHEKA